MTARLSSEIPKLCAYCDKKAEHFLLQVGFVSIRWRFVCRSHYLKWMETRDIKNLMTDAQQLRDMLQKTIMRQRL